MPPDITEPGSAEQRVANRVKQHVRIRVTEQPFFVGDFHTAHHELSAFDEAVDIITRADSHVTFS